jgi:hypothetical protein
VLPSGQVHGGVTVRLGLHLLAPSRKRAASRVYFPRFAIVS